MLLETDRLMTSAMASEPATSFAAATAIDICSASDKCRRPPGSPLEEEAAPSLDRNRQNKPLLVSATAVGAREGVGL